VASPTVGQVEATLEVLHLGSWMLLKLRMPAGTCSSTACVCLCARRDFIGWGYKPHLEVLDKLLSCLRLQLPKSPERPAAELQQRALQLQAQLQALPHPDAPGDPPIPGVGPAAQGGDASSGAGQQWLSTAALLRDLASQRRALSAEDRPYEVPFDKRAIDAVADAISMGILPSLKVGLGFMVLCCQTGGALPERRNKVTGLCATLRCRCLYSTCSVGRLRSTGICSCPRI
jgi:hypothetical protein